MACDPKTGKFLRTHGHSVAGAHTPEYTVWRGMKKRCLDPKATNYKWYGGIGIAVCDSWVHSFENFFRDMGARPSLDYSLDRIDNNGPYSPDNCRWATRLDQRLNSRNVRMIEFNGESRLLRDWAKTGPVSAEGISKRLKKGWSIEDALFRPPRRQRQKVGAR